jgi:hypothetical protein
VVKFLFGWSLTLGQHHKIEKKPLNVERIQPNMSSLKFGGKWMHGLTSKVNSFDRQLNLVEGNLSFK